MGKNTFKRPYIVKSTENFQRKTKGTFVGKDINMLGQGPTTALLAHKYRKDHYLWMYVNRDGKIVSAFSNQPNIVAKIPLKYSPVESLEKELQKARQKNYTIYSNYCHSGPFEVYDDLTEVLSRIASDSKSVNSISKSAPSYKEVQALCGGYISYKEYRLIYSN